MQELQPGSASPTRQQSDLDMWDQRLRCRRKQRLSDQRGDLKSHVLLCMRFYPIESRSKTTNLHSLKPGRAENVFHILPFQFGSESEWQDFFNVLCT